MNPKVSVIMITYRHEKYIEEAIMGVFLQKAFFPIEFIIANDCSADHTDEIIKQLVEKAPINIIVKYIRHKKNIGMNANFISATQQATGNYIALCEGDDYWTDPYKLQKQVNFLEANEDYAICFHEVKELVNDNLFLSNLIQNKEKQNYTIEDLAEYNFIHTASVLFRNGLLKEFPSWFNKSPIGDYPLHMLNAKYGKIKYFSEPMAVYRRHENSIWSLKSKQYMYENILITLEFLKEEVDLKVKAVIEKQQFRLLIDLAEEYKAQEDKGKYLSALAQALTINKMSTESWVSGNYFKVVEHSKALEARVKVAETKIPQGIWVSLKYFLKEVKLRIITLR